MPTYNSAAGCIYLICILAISVAGSFYIAGNISSGIHLFPRTARRMAVAAAILIASGTILSLLFTALGWTKSSLVNSTFTQWLLGLAALFVVPLGMELERRNRTKRGLRTSEPLAVGTAFILLMAISFGWVFGVTTILESLGVEVIINPLFAELEQDPYGLIVFLPIAIAAAILEETIFRLGIQGWLENYCRERGVSKWIGVAAASIIFSLGHASYLTPHGIKEVQIFFVGMILGWLKIHYGMRACILAHASLNFAAILLTLVVINLPF